MERRKWQGRKSKRLNTSSGGNQQYASINKGLAVPRSILIFKLTGERESCEGIQIYEDGAGGSKRQGKRIRRSELHALSRSGEERQDRDTMYSVFGGGCEGGGLEIPPNVGPHWVYT